MARQTYGVVRLDKVHSVYNGHIHSVVKEDAILENGMVGVLGKFLEGERELREFKAPTGTTEPIVLIASPEINYEQYKIEDDSLEYFHIPEGVPARAYSIGSEDIFSVSKKMVKPLDADTGVVAENFVVVEAGSHLLKEVASVTGTEAFYGEIVRTDVIGTGFVVGQAGLISKPIEFVVIDVKKNSL